MRTIVERIVLVEDDPDDCFLFRNALADVADTVQVQFVTDCDQLVSTLDACKPQLVFMDINMPKKNGFACIDELRGVSRYAAMPVIMYSCASEPKQLQKAYSFGAHLYLVKPNSYGELVASLRKIMELDWTAPERIRQEYFSAGNHFSFYR